MIENLSYIVQKSQNFKFMLHYVASTNPKN